jgi:hypothetical protein
MAAAFAALLWLAIVARRLPRSRCSTCGHSNYVHDSTDGRCRSKFGTGIDDDWVYRNQDLGCPCSRFTAPRRLSRIG